LKYAVSRAEIIQLLSGSAPVAAERDINIELLFPLSQLYGMEYYPALHRYHEK